MYQDQKLNLPSLVDPKHNAANIVKITNNKMINQAQRSLSQLRHKSIIHARSTEEGFSQAFNFQNLKLQNSISKLISCLQILNLLLFCRKQYKE